MAAVNEPGGDPGNHEVASAAADIRAAAARMPRAAEQEDIAEDGPLGIIVGVFKESLLALATTFEGLERATISYVADARKLAEAELEKLRQGVSTAQVVLNQATTAKAILEVQRETLVSRMIGDIAPKIAVGVKEVLVIRERRVNRDLDWRRRMATCAAALSLLLVGYVGRAIQDHDATEALSRCGKATVVDGATGRKYCPMETLLPQ